MKRIDRNAVLAYKPQIFTLIPLHKPDATRTKKGVTRKIGKAPLDRNWTKRPYDTRAVVARCLKENRNVGVRLTKGQLVLDIDPRNGGVDGFFNLCLELGLDPKHFPRVETGSGGSHYYMTKPTDVPVLDTLKDYPGVEFKSKGRQVVAAGSIHPDTLAYYKWDTSHPPIGEMPEAPRKLLNFIRRPQRSEVTGGGQYDQEQIAKMLEGLSPEDYADQHAWLKLMMACHHASNGDARSEFIEWSIGDPKYANDAEVIGRRWDSLHAEKNDGVTYRSLLHELREHNATHLLPVGDATGDFDPYEGDSDDEESEEDDRWLEGDVATAPNKKGKAKPRPSDGFEDDGVQPENPGGYTDEAMSMLEGLNEKYCTAVDGSKFKIVYRQYDPVMKRDFWIRMAPPDFVMLYGNKRVMRDTSQLSKNASEYAPLGKAWLEWAGRKGVEGVVFDPEREHEGYLNLWTGFAYEPSPKGEWSLLRELIFEVLSDGDDEIFNYVMNWCAWLFQNPGKQAEAAIVFRGGMGVGKGTLGNALTKLIGRHALAINSPELLIGRFNSHLQDVVFLFADEAIKPYDKTGESRLKSCISEPRLPFEGKGRDAVVATNVLHVMMASNENWVVPAGMDERRFLVSNANNKWVRNFDKFAALHEQLERDGGSGYRRMLHDFLKHDLPPNWHPRHLPTTGALLDQKIRSMSPLRQFFFDACMTGILPFECFKGVWDKEPTRFFAEDFRAAFKLWCRDQNINPGGSGRGNMRFVFQELKEMFAEAKTELRDLVPDDMTIAKSPSDNRAQSVQIPSLETCRRDFEVQLRGDIAWPSNADDEEDFG